MKQHPNITVVGSNMVDLLSYLERFPERGETVFGRGFVQGFGGKGANQAIMAAILGAKVSMVTCVGDDVFGPKWIETFEQNGVDTSFVKIVPDNYSGVAAIWVEKTSDNRIVLGAGANEEVSPEMVDEAFDRLPKPDVIISQLEIPQSSILRGFQRAKEVGATTILNPGPAAPVQKEILDNTDWLIPNETEFALLAKEMAGIDASDLHQAVRQFGDRTRVNLVVTLGKNGALLYMPGSGNDIIELLAPTVDAKDTTGAGDAFCGAFSYGIAAGLEPLKAIELANMLASDSVTRPGTQISYARNDHLAHLLEQVLNQPKR
ncbi:ribokinase [Paenibacillus sp. GCM10027626]|uniref:ribokinase n=1 Tax=Paenibacillus sp. GCM10027626 TaxID=3273411 RepID=UPI00363BCCEC